MARKTVLVCDNCGKEVDEAQGAALRVTYSDARRGSKVADLCDELRREDARPRRRAPWPPARRRRRPLRARKPAGAAAGAVLRPLYDGKVGLSLLAGPANAGKVALLLERYLARLDDEPVLIVPNASDVDRVERDLLARCGCLFNGEIVTFDRLFRLLAPQRPRPASGRDRPPALADRPAGGVRRVAERPVALGSHRRLRGCAAADRSASSSRGCSSPLTWAATCRCSTPPTAPSSTASASGTATCCAAGPQSAFSPTSTPGTASRCSPTASRT